MGIIMLTIATLNVHRHQFMSKMKFKYRQFCTAKIINLLLQNYAWVILCASVKQKALLKKGYLPNWTQELFRVAGVIGSQSPVTYKIEDVDGEPLNV